MPGSLDRDALRELLDELSRELEHRRTRAQIYIIGGAAISLAFDRRRTTHDVDARIESGHGQLIEAARTIGRRRGLPESWLNEQATAHMPKTRDTQARTVYESEYLTIRTNRRGTDPYARWCGRGGTVRCPPIPINCHYVPQTSAYTPPPGVESGRGRKPTVRVCPMPFDDVGDGVLADAEVAGEPVGI